MTATNRNADESTHGAGNKLTTCKSNQENGFSNKQQTSIINQVISAEKGVRKDGVSQAVASEKDNNNTKVGGKEVSFVEPVAGQGSDALSLGSSSCSSDDGSMFETSSSGEPPHSTAQDCFLNTNNSPFSPHFRLMPHNFNNIQLKPTRQ